MTTKTITAVVAGSTLTFNFLGGKSIEIDASTLSDQVKHDAMMHGLKQKIGDAGAKERGASLDSKFVDMMATVDSLLQGVWNRGRTGNGGVMAEALARATGKEVAEAAVIWAGKDEAGKKAIRNHPEVAKAYAAIMAERAATKADALADSTTDLASLI